MRACEWAPLGPAMPRDWSETNVVAIVASVGRRNYKDVRSWERAGKETNEASNVVMVVGTKKVVNRKQEPCNVILGGMGVGRGEVCP